MVTLLVLVDRTDMLDDYDRFIDKIIVVGCKILLNLDYFEYIRYLMSRLKLGTKKCL